MKTQKKNGQALYLQTSNKRWKWMAGATAATAATAAGVTASQASTITINLANNYISVFGGNHLNADLTGDGHPDLTIATPFTFSNNRAQYYSHTTASARVRLNGIYAHVLFTNLTNPETRMQLGSRYGHHYLGSYGNGTYSLMGSIPIFFKDLHINGGAPTRGSLQVTVSALGRDIQLDSLTYNSNIAVEGPIRAVPDQGSSLVLLAMGAGGVLALRRWRTAQGRS